MIYSKIRYILCIILCFYTQLTFSAETPWDISKDANHDGSFTISDVFIWITWLFFLPGNFALYFIIAQLPGFAHFFEISYKSYNGVLAGILSIPLWYFIFWLIGTILDPILEPILYSEENNNKPKKQTNIHGKKNDDKH